MIKKYRAEDVRLTVGGVELKCKGFVFVNFGIGKIYVKKFFTSMFLLLKRW